jgi:hypothetical protein
VVNGASGTFSFMVIMSVLIRRGTAGNLREGYGTGGPLRSSVRLSLREME